MYCSLTAQKCTYVKYFTVWKFTNIWNITRFSAILKLFTNSVSTCVPEVHVGVGYNSHKNMPSPFPLPKSVAYSVHIVHGMNKHACSLYTVYVILIHQVNQIFHAQKQSRKHPRAAVKRRTERVSQPEVDSQKEARLNQKAVVKRRRKTVSQVKSYNPLYKVHNIYEKYLACMWSVIIGLCLYMSCI